MPPSESEWAVRAARRPSFFDGVSLVELETLLGPLERRRYAEGSVVIADGDTPNEVYVALSGRGEVFVSDRDGVEHPVARVRPGATIGEISLLTGQPAGATVRATSELEVLVLSAGDFERVAEHFPFVWRNVGAILSERLTKADRRAVHEAPGRVAILEDWGAPPELAWALACSVAWHTRRPTQLVVLDDQPSDALAELARDGGGPPERAHLRVTTSLETLRTYSLAGQVEDAFLTSPYVLVHVRDRAAAGLADAPVIHLAGRSEAAARETAPGASVLRAWVEDGGRTGVAADGEIRVPALSADDVAALRRGRLPATTDAGRALGWVARDFAGLKVGLALGAGSLKGYAHVGVLNVLERAGLTPDYVAGSSIGAAVAGLYAMGYDPAKCADALDLTGPALFKPTLARSGLLSSRAVRKVLMQIGGDRRIEDLPLPLALVAADLASHREVMLRRGLLWLGVLSSISIPGIYPPQPVGPFTLVDGGVLNPVPASAVAAMGADVAIAVRLSSAAPPSAIEAEAVESAGPKPSLLAVAMQAIDIMYSRIVVDAPGATTITITPDLAPIPGAKLRHFTQGRPYVEAGEAAAEAALPRLTAALPWLRK